MKDLVKKILNILTNLFSTWDIIFVSAFKSIVKAIGSPKPLPDGNLLADTEKTLPLSAKKTILSYGTGFDVFRFVDLDTRLVESEDGVAENESVTFATRAAIEAAVVALIKQGDERGFWVLQKQGENDEKDT